MQCLLCAGQYPKSPETLVYLLIRTLSSRYCYLHFTDGERGTERLSDLLKVTQLLNVNQNANT